MTSEYSTDGCFLGGKRGAGVSAANCLLEASRDPRFGTIAGEALRRTGISGGALAAILSTDIACNEPMSGVCDLLILKIIHTYICTYVHTLYG